jgi:hypothetical protein
MFPSLRCAIQVVPFECGSARTVDGRRRLLGLQLDRYYGSMPSSNLGSQVTGTTPVAGFASSQANVSFGQVSTNLQQRRVDGYAGTDQREASRPSMVPVLQKLHLSTPLVLLSQWTT